MTTKTKNTAKDTVAFVEDIIATSCPSETEILKARITQLEDMVANLPKARDRGPKSEHAMTDEHAHLVLHGEHAETPHKKAALALGLSYGQVYSARGGYTFKAIFKGSVWEAKMIAKLV